MNQSGWSRSRAESRSAENAHTELEAVVDLDVAEVDVVRADGGEVGEDVVFGDAGAVEVPGAPAGGDLSPSPFEARVVLLDGGGECGEEGVAVGAGIAVELFELPALAGLEGKTFRVEDDLEAVGPEAEGADEAATPGEGEEEPTIRLGPEEGEVVDGQGAGRLGELVVPVVAVFGEVSGGAEGAGGLGEHLEALAVERGVRRQVVRTGEEHDLVDVDGGAAVVHEGGAAKWAVPGAVEMETGAGGIGAAAEANGGGSGVQIDAIHHQLAHFRIALYLDGSAEKT